MRAAWLEYRALHADGFGAGGAFLPALAVLAIGVGKDAGVHVAAGGAQLPPLAIRTRRPDEGLTLAEQGLVRADRLTETGLSILHTTPGRALAKMRRVSETLTAIGTAEDHFARSTPANDPPLLAHWNVAFLAEANGQALFDLAILHHNPAQATD